RLAALLGRLGDAHPQACCAGAAGAEIPAARARLEALLGRMLPDCRLAVVHDTRLVLAAAGIAAGIALVAGTGSVAYGRRADGGEAQRGGWGWLLGDDGSGVWITREAAREVTARADDRRPMGALGHALLAACRATDARELTANLHAMREPMQLAAAASAVFDTYDLDGASRKIGERIRAAAPRGFVIAARGSSDHAALYAKYLFGVRNQKLVALAAPSLFTHYARPPRLDGQSVIGISQSGESPDVVAVVEEARRQGSLTIAITNVAESRLARAAELVLPLEAGEEVSVPASKTYTASLVALALISQALDPDALFESALQRVPQAIARALEREN